MSLSASTLALFLILVPGLIFRYSLYHGTRIKRPFLGSSTIYSSIAVLLYSAFVFIIFTLIVRVLIWIYNFFSTYDLKVVPVEFNGHMYIFYGAKRFEIINFIVEYQTINIVLFVIICTLAFVIAKVVQYLGTFFPVISRFLYGPLSDMLLTRDTPLITCFVLTKIIHEKKRMMYAGFPEEISLREGNNIDHIIIRNPEKFYLRLNERWPSSTFTNSRPISTQTYSKNLLYISGAEIENVHFEGFYF